MSSEESFAALLKDYAASIRAEAADATGDLAARLQRYAMDVATLPASVLSGEITPEKAVTAAQAYADAASLATATNARELRVVAIQRATDFALRALAVAAAA